MSGKDGKAAGQDGQARGARPGGYRKLLADGEFDAAERSLERVLEEEPSNRDALVALSAFRWRAGRRAEARECLARAASGRPHIVRGDHDATKASFLQCRSFENNHSAIVKRKDGSFGTSLAEGHFSMKHLLDRKDSWNRYLVDIHRRSLLEGGFEEPWRLVINSISCPDLGGGALEILAEYLRARPNLAVVNHPDRVALTSRDENHRVLGDIDGLVFPKTVRFRSSETNAALLEALLAARGFATPLILRNVGTQTGESVTLVSDRDHLGLYLAQAEEGSEHYAIQYFDARGPTCDFHKTRIFFIDGRLYPVASLTSDAWQIHSADRYRKMNKEAWTREREAAFLEDPEAVLGAANLRRLHAVSEALRLDFFGIDFTLLPDGRLLVFEANAAMRHNFDHTDSFPYTRPHLEAITAAFTEMVETRCHAAPRSARQG